MQSEANHCLPSSLCGSTREPTVRNAECLVGIYIFLERASLVDLFFLSFILGVFVRDNAFLVPFWPLFFSVVTPSLINVPDMNTPLLPWDFMQ